MVWQLGIKGILAFPQELGEHIIQLTGKGLFSSHQLDQFRNVVRYIQAIYPTVILIVICPGSHPSGKAVIKGFYKLSILIFEMEKPGNRISRFL
jgi:hypothetical protein